MSDPIEQVVEGANAVDTVDTNFKALRGLFVGAFHQAESIPADLILALYGGQWGDVIVASDTVTLTDDAMNYVVMAISDGAFTAATTTTNWDDDTNYKRILTVPAADGTFDENEIEDYRVSPGGLFAGGAGGGGGSGTIGKHATPIMAGAMRPSVTGGCAALAAVASGSNLPDIVTLDFDPTTQEYAQFSIPMPKSWNEGTVTFKAIWSHPATTTNFGVVWDLQAVALGDGDAIGTAFGTAQTSSDTGGTTDDVFHSPESSAITIAGTPAAEDLVMFRLSRVTGNGSDTMTVDARLHGIVLYITTDAENDA